MTIPEIKEEFRKAAQDSEEAKKGKTFEEMAATFLRNSHNVHRDSSMPTSKPPPKTASTDL